MEKKTTTAAAKKVAVPKKHKDKYFFAVGRRKTAQARVKVWASGTGEITVNERPFEAYFPTFGLQKMAQDPLLVLGLEKKINAVITTAGGGVGAQAKASSLGIARALLLIDPNYRGVLKKSGFLSRDARKKERKKPGLKRARRRPQWQKR
ncbi:MAG: 30S ribosomal protein S9 [Candidatus Doudnabacteria bacterium RIFCSPHIGHO2_02_FULL_48_21]|uniref:Small ribosomal subunit protein uS9 n=1 Tax=Candidatus Doudnabacteria bacterium RIFCSPLOWO2_02_FULL_48_13 TaxID=1817845 RepID=A0A1F5QA64_9BACT|nr:MAG: 30S ribosomal protein S9 [Candidatus Doudnabacteria bacterium RIFCSPHIGHO2_01_48_18]OGE77228.1 MAG: 30S ribosomal protein S9 [Candidatus Doudnabacteria bacterium RIFCSPHIGHO2_01_FULL_48_180]OGE91090.1 MAG: 30S ribosomal protein S9 [Candidatus Doudnabacteria bacterium RIFCSPHIGHO2_12_FULL_47_25]OGE93780.1 MAG: 30S ribosomal protein S9 [Candidatus Doudnabacteria bacterium RIFCSPHIGHO2_02_FULL_48_21]OGE97151.1 MAG: 30S ribosomal protein S9 [Candidatus Doudnabacteria bacterium RIFCSPLOWO2_0